MITMIGRMNDEDRAVIVAVIVLGGVLLILLLIFFPAFGALAIAIFVGAVGLYYIIKLAIKAALRETHVKIDKGTPTE